MFATLGMFGLYLSNEKQVDNDQGGVLNGKTSSFPTNTFTKYLDHFRLRYIIFFEHMSLQQFWHFDSWKHKMISLILGIASLGFKYCFNPSRHTAN